MARSLNKGPFCDEMPTRRSYIIPSCIGETYPIHNGKEMLDLTITKHMIGHKFGEFIRTKKKALYPKKKNAKQLRR